MINATRSASSPRESTRRRRNRANASGTTFRSRTDALAGRFTFASCLVSGESEATAQQYLTLADGNVEMAISLMFEGGRPPETENANPEPPVRAPILPTREVLVPSEPMCSLPQLSNNVFDRFRDFAVETRTYCRITYPSYTYTYIIHAG